MRVLKNIVTQLHRWVFWALLSAVFWAWIFTLLTDTVPAKKVTLFVQTEDCRTEELALRLEEELPPGIKMVKVHPFSYMLFDNGELQTADLYVVRGSEMESLLPDFAPLDGLDWSGAGLEPYVAEGRTLGVKIWDAASGTGAAEDYLGYEPGEDYYLCMNADSPHLGSGDGAALRIAEALLKIG